MTPKTKETSLSKIFPRRIASQNVDDWLVDRFAMTRQTWEWEKVGPNSWFSFLNFQLQLMYLSFIIKLLESLKNKKRNSEETEWSWILICSHAEKYICSLLMHTLISAIRKKASLQIFFSRRYVPVFHFILFFFFAREWQTGDTGKVLDV